MTAEKAPHGDDRRGLEPSRRETTGIPSKGDQPTVTVVVPTYNRPDYLKSCLESLAHQTMPSHEFEIVVVDDGSAQPVEDIVSSVLLGTEVAWRYIRANHQGPAAARNEGLRVARAVFVAFIDDDCVAEPTWLEELLRPFESDEVEGVEGRVVRDPDCHPFTHFVENLHGGLYLTANMAYRRETLEAVGGFDERYPHAAAEDWDLAFRVLETGGKIAFRPEAGVTHSPVSIDGKYFTERVQERRSAAILHRRFPERWAAVTGRTMRRSFVEGVLLAPVVEVRKWRNYFLRHPRVLPRFLFWQVLASGRLLHEYIRLRRAGEV